MRTIFFRGELRTARYATVYVGSSRTRLDRFPNHPRLKRKTRNLRYYSRVSRTRTATREISRAGRGPTPNGRSDLHFVLSSCNSVVSSPIRRIEKFQKSKARSVALQNHSPLSLPDTCSTTLETQRNYCKSRPRRRTLAQARGAGLARGVSTRGYRSRIRPFGV